MDRITKSLLDKFTKQNNLNDFSEDKAFEHFIGYIITSLHYQESFDSNDISTGSGNDTGIDSISIMINGSFIVEPEEVADIADSSSYLDVEFIMTQSETSSNFDSKKIGSFCYGVKDIFLEKSITSFLFLKIIMFSLAKALTLYYHFLANDSQVIHK